MLSAIVNSLLFPYILLKSNVLFTSGPDKTKSNPKVCEFRFKSTARVSAPQNLTCSQPNFKVRLLLLSFQRGGSFAFFGT